LRADASLSGDDYRERLGVLLVPFEQTPVRSRTAAVRAELIAHIAPVRALLAAIRDIRFDLTEDHPLAIALPLLHTLYETQQTRLPEDAENPFPPVWTPFIERDDRAAALAGYEIATLMLLKRSLRNGTASVDHSLSFRAPQRLLIPPEMWEKEHSRLYHDLNLPVSAETYLLSIRDTLRAGLAEVAEAVQAGAVSIESGKIHLPRLRAQPETDSVKEARERLYAAIGEVQLPDLILEVDSYTHFSWVLLGRSPKSERELITLYGALLAHGTDLTAAEVVRMIPGTNADSVSQLMRLLEEDSVLRAANDRVVEHMRAHAIAQHWGRGLFASSDMMSLEATRHLWNARLDPRRRTYAIGTYTHVLDQWGILYDQPIVLNRRQAGAALEGALRQRHVDLERLAVDTHGFTHVAMALAKLLGFDLCPRLAHLSERKLYVPRGIDVPEVLRPVMEQIPTRAISEGWDPLVRVAASTGAGWCPATLVLGWYGSAARGNPVFEAGNALGKLQRTVYLCDFFGNPVFRREVLDVLNQGESVHDLQRAVHNGVSSAKRGRSKDELVAISGALALLANIIMAFNTRRMQAVIDALPDEFGPEALTRIAPVHYAQINMRGTFTFSLARFRHRLFESPLAARARRDRTQ
jgi:TnpA family transposase